ncbi:PilZ domain-containing protein [Sphingomonas sp. A2-49]|uniref:PilZ domain-containing protein n=1 Tax=Sphingomonas sp. A2-49 TaxID=1391375 RepID=UPI0021D38501|nr:PilZ domain-containing protein [Sphingomonas sp. A2-49]MCU6452795.1 PilZ domain-containing protein [Sphingomonas sp. A2-49]
MDSFSYDPSERPVPVQDGGDGEGSQRSRARDSLFLMAPLRFEDEESVREVRVRNLSEGGLMVDCPRVRDPGTPVVLDLRGIGEVTGKVAWCTEGRIGIALDRPIDPMRARKPIGAVKR